MEKFENIKAGDKVVVVTSYCKDIYEVERVTKTQIIIGSDKFRKSDGIVIGETWNFRKRIVDATPELFEEIKKQKERQKYMAFLRKIQWENISLNKMKQVYEIISNSRL